MTRLHVVRGSRLPLLTAGMVGLATMIGCGGPKPATPTDTTQLPSGAEVQARSADVFQRAKEFSLLSTEIKQTDVTKQSPKLQSVFADLSMLLPRLAGSKPGGVLMEQFRTVTQTRDELAALPPGTPIPQGLVDNGLTAAVNTLQQLGTSSFYADAKMTAKLDELHRLLLAQQGSTGTEHAFAVRDVITVVGETTLMMAQVYHDRANAGDGPDGAGASTNPSSAPATQPADQTPPASPATPTPPVMPTVPAVPPPATQPAAIDPATQPATPGTPATPADPASTPAAPPPAVPPATPPTSPEAPAVPATPDPQGNPK